MDISNHYRQAYREVLIKDRKKGFKIHLLVYIIFNIAMVIFNLSMTPEVKWFIGALLGWGSGVLSHYIFSVALVERVIDKIESEVDAKALKLYNLSGSAT